MDPKTKNNFLRLFLLLFITGMLAAIAWKLHFGKETIAAITGISNRAPLADSSEADPEIRIGPVADQSLTPDSDNSGPLPITTSKSEDVPRILKDGSRLIRMEDGYGNTTITRTFRGNKLLRMVMIRYQGNGVRKVFVYGKNGSVKTLDETHTDHVLSAPAKAIAATAKISGSENVNQKRKERLAIIRNSQRMEAEEKRLAELPVYVAPVESEVIETADQKENINLENRNEESEGG